MVNGQFKCLGAAQHLKHRFGRGYSLAVKVKPVAKGPGDTAAVKRFVDARFPGSVLQAEHNGQVSYQVPETEQWGRLFATLEAARGELAMEDYSVSQTSLEQIFLDFAAEQNDEAKKIKKAQVNRQPAGGARGEGLQVVTTRV